jgi:hypothetical protein
LPSLPARRPPSARLSTAHLLLLDTSLQQQVVPQALAARSPLLLVKRRPMLLRLLAQPSAQLFMDLSKALLRVRAIGLQLPLRQPIRESPNYMLPLRRLREMPQSTQAALLRRLRNASRTSCKLAHSLKPTVKRDERSVLKYHVAYPQSQPFTRYFVRNGTILPTHPHPLFPTDTSHQLMYNYTSFPLDSFIAHPSDRRKRI